LLIARGRLSVAVPGPREGTCKRQGGGGDAGTANPRTQKPCRLPLSRRGQPSNTSTASEVFSTVVGGKLEAQVVDELHHVRQPRTHKGGTRPRPDCQLRYLEAADGNVGKLFRGVLVDCKNDWGSWQVIRTSARRLMARSEHRDLETWASVKRKEQDRIGLSSCSQKGMVRQRSWRRGPRAQQGCNKQVVPGGMPLAARGEGMGSVECACAEWRHKLVPQDQVINESERRLSSLTAEAFSCARTVLAR